MHTDPIIRYMHACFLAGVPAVLEGAPGTGKTERGKWYSAATDRFMARWILSRCEPIDIKPRMYHEGKVIIADPPEVAEIRERVKAGGRALMFCDELNRAEKSTEGAMLDLFDSMASPEIGVLIGINPPSRGQSARPLDSATSNRFCHLKVESDVEAWCRAQIYGWPTPSNVDLPEPDAARAAKCMAKASALISSFVKKAHAPLVDEKGVVLRKALLSGEPDNPNEAHKAWGSMRSWEAARKLHGMAMALDLDANDTRTLIAGCVGDAPALEYMTYVVDADLPDAEEILQAPDKWTPQAGRGDRTYAAVSSIVAAVQREFTDLRWRAAWVALGQCEKVEQVAEAAAGAELLSGAYDQLGKKDLKAKQTLTDPVGLMRKHLPRVVAAWK